LHAAIELYDEGQHLASLARTFEHLFPDHEVPDLSQEAFSFAQGSSRVRVAVEDGVLRVRVPLVRLTEQSITTAALRFVLSRISGTGQLHQPCLRGDDIFLEFSDPVTRLHPHKVLEVLRQMPVEADAHDDWMVEEFQCAPLEREPIEELTDEEFARAEEIWRTHWDDVDELVKESQRKRSMFFLNEITAYAVHHLRQSLPLTGYWWSRISAAADTFNDTGFDPSARESALSKCTKEMKAVSSESLRSSLGHAHYAISPLADGSPKILSTNLGSGEYLDTIVRLHNGGRYMDAAVGLIGTYNYLLARFAWPPQIEKLLFDGLALASGRPWREATTALLAHGELLTGDDDDDDGEDEDDDGDDGDDGDAQDDDEVSA
jgi:hypothetical protein